MKTSGGLLSRRPFIARLCVAGCLWLSTWGVSSQLAWSQPANPATPATPEGTPPAPADEAKLPQLKDVPLPTAEELLRGRPTDWIVLPNQDVLFVEPVQPRPDTVAKLKEQYELLQKVPITQIPLEEKLRKLAELQRLQVTLLTTDDDPEFVLELRYIFEIIYFETQIVRRISKLLDANELIPAYELLMFLDRRHRDWPGFADLYQRFLFLEANQLLSEGNAERALLSAEQLFALKSDYPDLSRLLGRIVDALIEGSVESEDFRQARHFLARLRRLQSDHFIVSKWTTALSERTRSALAVASAAESRGDFRTAAVEADRASRIWPDLPELREQHRRHTSRYQILKVGIVREVSPQKSYPFETLAAQRMARLCAHRLFEEERVEDGRVRYSSRYIEAWDPRDLGREVHFRLQHRRAPWESRPILSSGQILETLADRRQPQQPAFDARWQREMTSLHSSSPAEWTLSLSRIPLRLESRLRVPVAMSSESIDWSRDLASEAALHPNCTRFFPAASQADSTSYRRTRPQQPGPEEWHVAEIEEREFPSWDRLVQALMRGEIDYVPSAEWVDVAALSADQRFLVTTSALPRTDLLQIHPDSVLTTNASLRRALLYSLDRRQLLAQQVLQGAQPAAGRLVTGPFATTLAAYDAQLRQPDYDLFRAAALVATVRRQGNGELPVLRLSAPGDAVTARVIPELIAAWKRVGLTVEWQRADDGAPWDLAYRTLRLYEPTDDIWSLLRADGRTDWQDLSIYPHWLRERLWELEQTVDWSTAQRLLREIQREFLIEARWLPLWEVDEFSVTRRRIIGISTRPIHPYQGVERWTVQPWYPTETP